MSEDGEIQTPVGGEAEAHWSAALVGDNEDRATAMSAFETPDDFFTSNDSALDWRRGLAGDDDKYYAELQRFKAPLDYGNSFREAQQTIRAGNLKAALKDDATEEDVQAYREANGIPLEVDGYFKDLPDGLVVGENDQEIFNDFAGSMHEMNVEAGVIHKVIEWYSGFSEQQQDAQLEADGVDLDEATNSLRESWGADYRANINLVGGLLESTFGSEAKEQLLNGRFQDGRAFMNDPNILKGLSEIARKLNPVHQLVTAGNDATSTLNDEISDIEKVMREDRTTYNKDLKMQERYRQLLQIRIDQDNAA